MDAAPILLPSPQKSPFRTAYAHEILDGSSEEEEEHRSYDPSPDEIVFDDSQDDSQDASSPHTSDDDLSTIPPDPDSRAPSTIYTPHKRRSPFRHPSSVRNIQLDTTPPHLVSSARREYFLSSPSRNSTPRSHYSAQSRPHSARSSPAKKQKQKPKKEHPLVLLHLTLLPLSLSYSQSLLETVLPPKKLADCKLLKEKLGASVIQERGVLIPHPKDDYDLLEERLLEALELEQGALTRDGHFLIPEERASRAGSQSIARTRYGSEDILEEEEDEDTEDDARTEMADSPLCDDCGKHIRTIDSDRRWDVRVYAANGLMREGAWSAAWREMERVDVEIKPFIHDDLKRELEDRWEEMELLLSAPKELTTPAPTEEIIHQSIESDESFLIADVPTSSLRKSTPTVKSPSPVPVDTGLRLSSERLKEIYGEQADAKIESMKEETGEQESVRYDTGPRTGPVEEIPISTLLFNYTRCLLQDRRNVAIFCLSAVVLFMATQVTGSMPTASGVVSTDMQSAVAKSLASAEPSALNQAVTITQIVQVPTTVMASVQEAPKSAVARSAVAAPHAEAVESMPEPAGPTNEEVVEVEEVSSEMMFPELNLGEEHKIQEPVDVQEREASIETTATELNIIEKESKELETLEQSEEIKEATPSEEHAEMLADVVMLGDDHE